jgi:hypothetical protein
MFPWRELTASSPDMQELFAVLQEEFGLQHGEFNSF